MSKQPEATFRNHYHCNECLHEWTDDWDATSDDDCPLCGNRACSPFLSEDLDDDGNVIPSKLVTLRLTLTVTYDTRGATVLELKQRLAEIVANATGEGAFTGDTFAECEEISSQVEEIK